MTICDSMVTAVSMMTLTTMRMLVPPSVKLRLKIAEAIIGRIAITPRNRAPNRVILFKVFFR